MEKDDDDGSIEEDVKGERERRRLLEGASNWLWDRAEFTISPRHSPQFVQAR